MLNNADFLEFLNGYLMLIDLAIIAVLGMYLLRRGKGDKGWYDAGTQLSLAIVLYLLGHVIIRGWTWFWRFSDRMGWWVSHEVTETFPVVPLGLIVATVGLIWMARSLYRPLGLKIWIVIAVGLAIGAASVTWGMGPLFMAAGLVLFLLLVAATQFIERPH